MAKRDKATRKLNNDLYLLAVTPIVFVAGIFTYVSSIMGDILWVDGHTWMNIHAISSIAIYFFVIRHIIHHWIWYKKNFGRFTSGLRHLWLFSTLFVLTGLTGCVILFFSGENSVQWLILVHTLLGTLTTYFVIHHIVKYFPVITKWIKHKLKR